ncbi:MAG: PqqD family protein [Candidatus Omnitrophota bacterium]
MELNTNLNTIYKPSEDVVARDVQGEFIIIPITSGIADSDEEIFSLNESGRAVWEKLDGKRTLEEIVDILALEFDGSVEEIKKDCLGISEELLKRKMITEL